MWLMLLCLQAINICCSGVCSGAGKEGTRRGCLQHVSVAKQGARLWDISSLRSFIPRIRAKALGMLLGECGSSRGLCNALNWFTDASLEERERAAVQRMKVAHMAESAVQCLPQGDLFLLKVGKAVARTGRVHLAMAARGSGKVVYWR